MDNELIDLVDESDNIIGKELKSECHKKGLWHRGVSIFVLNKKGKLLVQKRSANVPCPNLFCSSASGHLQKGESYEMGAKRELKEELGIECNLKFIGKLILDVVYPNGEIDKEHYALYSCVYDGRFNIQKEELSSVKFFPIDKIKEMIERNEDKFTPGFRQEFQHYLASIKHD